MRFLCPFCNSAISAEDSARGFRVLCSGCEKSILVPSGQFDTGCVIGDFAIRSKLGAGAIGSVYKAYQISLERIVALKILSKKYMTIRGVEEFMREARAAANLSHPNLVQSYAVGEDQGICYMAMLYINGETLKSRIRREGRIPCDEALHIIQQVAEALHYAWTEAGLVHRDVKLDNIMLAEHGIVKLTDLGLAIKEAEWHEGMDISGSPSYMSPEQFAGEKLDTRSDIYSLGVTLYQMLTGQLPYDAKTVGSIAQQHFEQPIPNVNKILPDIPASVNNLIRKMLAKHRNKRFKDMDALLKEIWKIRQTTSPNRRYVPAVHTVSMRRLDYDMQNIARDKDADGGDIVIPPRPANHAVWAAVSTALLVSGLAVSSFLYLKLRTAEDELTRIAAFQTQEQDVLNFATLASEPARPTEELNTELTRIMGNINALSGDSVRKRMMIEYLADIMALRASQKEVTVLKYEKSRLNDALTLAGEKARTDANLSEETSSRKIGELRAEYEQKIHAQANEIESLTMAHSDCDARQKTFLEQITLLDEEIAKLNQELAESRQEKEKNKTFRNDYRELVKIQLAETVCDSVRHRRFDVAEEKITKAGTVFPELADEFYDVLAVVHECKRIHNFFQQDPDGALTGKTFASGARVINAVSGGTITYHLQENPAISLKCNMMELTNDALLALLNDPAAGQKSIAALEFMRGNYGAAVAAWTESEAVAGLVDIYAAQVAERIRVSYPSDSARKSYETFRKRFYGARSYTKLEEKLKILFKEKTLE